MSKKLLFLNMMIFMSWNTYSQSLSYKKLYSTTGPSNQSIGILEQTNGDLITAGIRSVPMGGGQYIANVIMLRLKSNGDTVWTKEIGTTTDREVANGMAQLSNGKIVIVGSVNLPPNGLADAYVVCTDTAGRVLWEKRYGGSQTDALRDVAIDGEYIIACGITESFGGNDNDVWLVKIDQAGDTLWTKTFGGTLADNANAIVVANGAYYIAGATNSYANGQQTDVWLIKTDTAGNEVWNKSYGVKDKLDEAWGMTLSYANGNIDGLILTGVKDTEPSQPNSAYGSMYLSKVDTSGAVVWDKSISATSWPNWRQEGFDIKRFDNGGYSISGFKLNPTIQSQQMYVVKTDASGVVLWDTTIGTSDSNYFANAIAITNDGGWAVTGSVFNIPQQMRYIYVAKFSPNSVDVSDQVALQLIEVYPNPTSSGSVNIRSSKATISRVDVMSIDGKLLHSEEYEIVKSSCSIPVHHSGVLILSIHTEKGIVRQRITSVK